MLESSSVQSIVNTILLIIAIVGICSVAYFVWRNKGLSVQKDVIEAYGVRQVQIEQELVSLKNENKELHAQINQLIGENKALKTVVVKPDKIYQETTTAILGEIKQIREDFLSHSGHDDDRFKVVGEYAQDNNNMLKLLTKGV